ncbi:MAG TPA: CRISPR-associated endonuclease Cas1 [Candidatus Acidoferrum sp.]|nr:CRISPR-associated endonuclease Cas1 [Candidatus Acidoferrum sp.]
MAASATVSQFPPCCNSLIPKRGVITLFGYGIAATVARGHLMLKCGIGSERYEGHFARIGHGLRRLVVIGSDGFVSLAALRWLADQDATFVMLERDDSVLAVTGPVRSSDARLRRAQALAHASGTAVEIARELIRRKLDAQRKLAGDGLGNAPAAQQIACVQSALADAKTIEAIRLIESQAAFAYWSAWRTLPITFPKKDVSRIPDHWKKFGSRVSPLTGSPRLAANPPNAMLNYLYALLESEARLAVAALGLDPGLGVLHMDAPARDSLACDVMEPIRPEVDAYVLRWITHGMLKREWFLEQRNGNARLMGTFAVQLCETLPTWGCAVAPIAEYVAKALWRPKARLRDRHPTRLTQSHRREASDSATDLPSIKPPRPDALCQNCGASIGRARTYCVACANISSTARLLKVAEQGRILAHTDAAEARRGETQKRQWTGRGSWKPTDLPDWLNEEVYRREIQPKLKEVSLSEIAAKLGISIMWASDIRRGRCIPHPRHWSRLARLARVGICHE